MHGLLAEVYPDGLLEYSAVYADRASNRMPRRFQQVTDLLARVAASSRLSCPSTWVVAVLLACVAGTASAAWVRVRGDGAVTVLADPGNVERSAGRATMWSVINYTRPRKNAEGKEFVSSKQRIEYDCVEERSRHLVFSRHTEPTGWGETVYLNNALGEWTPLPAGTVGAALRQFACHLP